jgi:hypothetical protein
MSGEDAPRPCPENLIVPEIKTNKQAVAQVPRVTPMHVRKITNVFMKNVYFEEEEIM